MFALIHFVNADRSISKTSLEQEWGKPSDSQIANDLYAKGLAVADFFKKKEPVKELNISSYNLTYADLANHPCALRAVLREELKTEGERAAKSILMDCIALAIILINERNCDICIQRAINESRKMKVYFSNSLDELESNLLDFYRQRVVLSEIAIKSLCLRTKDQSNSTEWAEERLMRISASDKAHSIKCRKTKSIDKLLEEFLNPVKLIGAAKKMSHMAKKMNQLLLQNMRKPFMLK